MERLKLTIGLDQNFTEKELHKIAEAFGGAFDLKDRTYILKTSEESPPTAVFALGEITVKNIPQILGVMKSDYWKKAAKKISKTLSKRRKDEEPMISFECTVEGLDANMRCRTSNNEIVEAAFGHLDSALESLWELSQKKNLPGSKTHVYMGYHEPTKSFRIDRAIVLGTDFGEYEFDEKARSWRKISRTQG